MTHKLNKPRRAELCRIARDELGLQLGEPRTISLIADAMRRPDPLAYLRQQVQARGAPSPAAPPEPKPAPSPPPAAAVDPVPPVELTADQVEPLDDLDEGEQVAAGEILEGEAPELPPAPAEPQLVAINLELPLAAAPPAGYQARHIEMRLVGDEPATAARILAGLRAANAELASGRRVESLADLVRYLLHQAAAAA